jgi:hypothetical protein
VQHFDVRRRNNTEFTRSERDIGDGRDDAGVRDTLVGRRLAGADRAERATADEANGTAGRQIVRDAAVTVTAGTGDVDLRPA